MVFPNAGPISHPTTVELNVAIAKPMTGSVGMTLVILSARAGISEKAYRAPAVEAREPRIEEARE
jgi:hypothetical protein